MLNFYKIIFFNMTIFSTLIVISSMSWLYAWMGLEMNLLSIIPLMINNKSSSESSIKYFIIQAMASSLFLFCIIMNLYNKNFNLKIEMYTSMMLNMAILLKMGAAPLHFWLPEVVSGLNWNMTFMVLTWQKIAPMILLSYTLNNMKFMMFIIMISAMIGSLQGFNQTCLRKILAYSSINHMSWMLASLMYSLTIWMVYFLIYSIINAMIILMFKKYNIFFINQNNSPLMNKMYKFLFMMNFLSLGGLPPFTGFFPKWITMNFLINNNFYLLTMIMILFTLISLYIYLRLTFSTLTLNSNESLIYTKYNNNFMYFFLNYLSLMLIFMMFSILNFL